MLWHCELLPQFYWSWVGVQQIPYSIIPKWVPSAASITIDTTIVDFLTCRTKMLHADKFRYMFVCRVGIRLVLCGLKNVKYIQYIIRVVRQDVLKWSHVTEMTYISVLVTDFTIALITFMAPARHECPTLSTISPKFSDWFLIRGTLFLVRETRVAPEMFITFCTG